MMLLRLSVQSSPMVTMVRSIITRTFVEETPADPKPEKPPGEALERSAVERRQLRLGHELPEPLVEPEVRVVDRASVRRERTEQRRRSLHESMVKEREERDGQQGRCDREASELREDVDCHEREQINNPVV